MVKSKLTGSLRTPYHVYVRVSQVCFLKEYQKKSQLGKPNRSLQHWVPSVVFLSKYYQQS